MKLNLWKNSVQDDLVSIDKQITDVNKKIADLRSSIQNAGSMINQCETEKSGLFNVYNCKANTGRTLNEWYAVKENGESELATLSSQLNNLKKDRVSTLDAIKQAAIASGASAEAAEQQAQAASQRSKASAEQAKSVGVWVGVGVLGIAALALIYMKIIKKK